jgi:hypothetical protein
LNTAVTFLSVLDARTLLYIAPGESGSGSWLWAYDVPSGVTRRFVSGVEQFTSVSASRDGRRVVVTKANPTTSLWRVPVLSVAAEEAYPYPVPTERALDPRYGGASFFYLSAGGAAEGLWRLAGGTSLNILNGADSPLFEPPAPSPDGQRVAVIRRRDGKHLVTIMSANGTDSRTLAPTIDASGAAEWSPDGKSIAVGGTDAQGQRGLFLIHVDGQDAGKPVRLVDGEAINPIWSRGNVIVYAGPFTKGQVSLLGVRPDRTPVELPPVRVSPGGYRFLRDGTGLVYLPRPESLDFWLLDLATGNSRQLTRLDHAGRIRRFDLTPDGKQIVFDLTRQNADIVLIDIPKN